MKTKVIILIALILALVFCFMGCSKYVSNWIKVQDDVNVVEKDSILYQYETGDTIAGIKLEYNGNTIADVKSLKVYTSGRVEAYREYRAVVGYNGNGTPIYADRADTIITSIELCKITITNTKS